MSFASVFRGDTQCGGAEHILRKTEETLDLLTSDNYEMVALPQYYHGKNIRPEEWKLTHTQKMPFLRLTKGEFDHKFVGSLCILDYDPQLEQINCSFLMGSTRGEHFFAS